MQSRRSADAVTNAFIFLPQDEFSLGEWDKSTVTGQGDDLIHQSEEGTGESVIVLEVSHRWH